MTSPETLNIEHLRTVYAGVDVEALLKNANIKLLFKMSEGANLEMVDNPTHSVVVGTLSE
jgi:hypothetical protein